MGIELHYAAQLTVQSVRGFENGGHHFPAAKSALPAVDEPPAGIFFLSSLPLLLCCCARSLANRHHVSVGESVVVHAHCSLAPHMQTMPHPQETCLHSCSINSHTYIHIYIHTYIYTNVESSCNMISCLTSCSAIKLTS